MLFFAGDGPPGFEVMRRRRGREWIGQNDALLRLSDTSFDRLYVTILTTLIGEGGREVAVAKTRRQANQVIDAVIEYVRRLMAGGPWKPSRLASERALRPCLPSSLVGGKLPAPGAGRGKGRVRAGRRASARRGTGVDREAVAGFDPI